MKRLNIKQVAALTVSLTIAQSSALSADSYPQAVKDYSAGNYARALSQFKSLEVTYPTNILVHYYAALCQQAVGHLDQARTEYSWVIANGDAKYKSMATTGLNQLANARTQIAYASPSQGAISPDRGSGAAPSTAPKAKLKKAIEFYADW